MILHKSFNPSIYPFEVYQLPISFVAVASIDNMRLHLLSDEVTHLFEADMPAGWYSEAGFKCTVRNESQALQARGGGNEITHSQIVCRVVIYGTSDAWWLSTFVFWTITLLSNLISGLFVFSASTNSHELRDALNQRGTFASGAILACADPKGSTSSLAVTSLA